MRMSVHLSSFVFTDISSHVCLSKSVGTCAHVSVDWSIYMSTHKSAGKSAGLNARLRSSLTHANPNIRCSTHMVYMHACSVTALLVVAGWRVLLRCCSARASIVIVSLSVPAEAGGTATDTWMYWPTLLLPIATFAGNGHVLALTFVDKDMPA